MTSNYLPYKIVVKKMCDKNCDLKTTLEPKEIILINLFLQWKMFTMKVTKNKTIYTFYFFGSHSWKLFNGVFKTVLKNGNQTYQVSNFFLKKIL